MSSISNKLMQYIGNIVSDIKLDDNVGIFHVTSNLEDIIMGIPTLVVGWSKVKQLFDNVSILKWEIDANTYWTFSKYERRNRLNEDLIKFKNLCVDRTIKGLTYVYFNSLISSKYKKSLMLNSLNDGFEKKLLIWNDMCYICWRDIKFILGISMRDVEYEGKERQFFIETMKSIGGMTQVGYDDNKNKEALKLFYNKNYALSYLFD